MADETEPNSVEAEQREAAYQHNIRRASIIYAVVVWAFTTAFVIWKLPLDPARKILVVMIGTFACPLYGLLFGYFLKRFRIGSLDRLKARAAKYRPL